MAEINLTTDWFQINDQFTQNGECLLTINSSLPNGYVIQKTNDRGTTDVSQFCFLNGFSIEFMITY